MTKKIISIMPRDSKEKDELLLLEWDISTTVSPQETARLLLGT